MGICWGDPSFPTPTELGGLKSKMTWTIGTTTSSETTTTIPSNERIWEGSGLRNFTLAQLTTATGGFGADTFLGEGDFGKVFKGLIDEGATSGSEEPFVAVKKLNQGSLQGFREWQREIMFLSTLSHPNIVKLLGYCHEDKQLLLVYEFASKRSLDNHLYGWGSIAYPLPWDRRLKIAVGVARGLAFLHTREREIIYRDIKPANILLDGSYTAKLADFGLARFGPSEVSHLTTSVMGCGGYAAPEYLETGRLSTRSDVYGFGIVLLELLVGRKAIDPKRPEKEQNLVKWSRLHLPWKKYLVAIMDANLKGKYSLEGAKKVALLALECLQDGPYQRPSITEVVAAMEKIEAASEGLNYD